MSHFPLQLSKSERLMFWATADPNRVPVACFFVHEPEWGTCKHCQEILTPMSSLLSAEKGVWSKNYPGLLRFRTTREPHGCFGGFGTADVSLFLLACRKENITHHFFFLIFYFFPHCWFLPQNLLSSGKCLYVIIGC